VVDGRPVGQGSDWVPGRGAVQSGVLQIYACKAVDGVGEYRRC